MKKIIIALLAVLLPLVVEAGIRKFSPQGPAGHSSCTGVNANKDLDGDGKPGSVDTGCTGGAYDQMSSVTGGYSGLFENAFITADLEVVVDAESPTGFSVQLKSTARVKHGDARMCGNFSAGDYYVKVFGTVSGTPSIYIDSAVLADYPDATKRSALGTPELQGWTPNALQAGYNPRTDSYSNTDFKLTLSGDACIDVRIYDGTKITTLFLSTNSTQTPQHPATGPTPSYTIYKKGAGNTITIDGVGDEGVWANAAGAPVVSWLGSQSSNDTGATLQFVRDGATVYFLAKANDADISCTSSGFDQNNTWQACDHWEFLFQHGQDTTRDSETVKFDVDTNENVYDANWDGGSETSVFDFTNVSVNCTVVANVSKVCEGKYDLPWTPTDNLVELANFLHSDYDAAAFTFFGFGISGSFNALANARPILWSSTALGTLTTPDVTAPTLSAFSSGTPGSTTVQLSVTSDEPASCTFKYGTSSAAYGSYPNTAGTVATQLSGSDNIATINVSGLVASTGYFWRVQCSDSVPNTTTSAEQTFSTAAAPAASCGLFTLTSTVCASTGATLADRRTTYANKQTNSDNIIADFANYTDTSIGFNNPSPTPTGDRPVFCVATNSDPLRTVTVAGPGDADTTGWYTLHLPNSCSPGGTQFDGKDRHVIVTNSDDDSFVWEMYRAWNASGTWTADRMRRWCRKVSACTGQDGAARGVLSPQGNDGNRGVTACAGAAIKSLAIPRKSEIAAGNIPHALAVIVTREFLSSGYTPLYPCNFGSQGGSTSANSPKMGMRIMLDPDFNVDALAAGAALKTMLKALQNYGGIIMDTAGDRMKIYTENADWTGYDFTQPANLETTIMSNSHIIKCINSFGGECPAGE